MTKEKIFPAGCLVCNMDVDRDRWLTVGVNRPAEPRYIEA